MDCDNAMDMLPERQSKCVIVLLNNLALRSYICGSRIIKYCDTETIFWFCPCRHNVLSDLIKSNSVLPTSRGNKNTVCETFMDLDGFNARYVAYIRFEFEKTCEA
jgi:hypothetical protein